MKSSTIAAMHVASLSIGSSILAVRELSLPELNGPIEFLDVAPGLGEMSADFKLAGRVRWGRLFRHKLGRIKRKMQRRRLLSAQRVGRRS